MKKTLRFCGWLVMLWVVSFMLQPMPFVQADDESKFNDDKKVTTVAPEADDAIDEQDSVDDNENAEPEDDDEDEDD